VDTGNRFELQMNEILCMNTGFIKHGFCFSAKGNRGNVKILMVYIPFLTKHKTVSGLLEVLRIYPLPEFFFIACDFHEVFVNAIEFKTA